jgi:hypothetical protein
LEYGEVDGEGSFGGGGFMVAEMEMVRWYSVKLM